MCSDSKCILKLEPIRFADGSVVENESKKVAEKKSNCVFTLTVMLLTVMENSVWQRSFGVIRVLFRAG